MATRQQRRSQERLEAKLRDVKRQVTQEIAQNQTVQAMWRSYSSRLPLPADMLWPIEQGFYAGASAMFELVTRVAPDHVSEEQGAAMLERLEEEIRTHVQGLS